MIETTSMYRYFIFCALGLLVAQLNGSPIIKKDVNELNSLAGSYLNSNYDSAISIAERAYSKAVEINYLYGIAKSLAMQARGLDLKGMHNSAQLLYMESLYHFKSSDTLDYYNEYSLLRNLGRSHYLFKQYKTAIVYYDSALKTLNKYIEVFPDIAGEYGDDKLIAGVLFDKAINLFEIGKLDEAQHLFQEAEDRAWDEENYNLIANIRNELGLIFSGDSNYVKAKDFYFPVLGYADLDTVIRARILHNIGSTYLKENRLDQAKQYLLEAINFNKNFVDKREQFLSLLFLGQIYLEGSSTLKALDTWEQALQLPFNIDSNPDHFIIYRHLRDVHYSLKQYDQFQQYQLSHDVAATSYMLVQQVIQEKDQMIRFALLTDVFFDRKQQKEVNQRLYIQLMVVVPSFIVLVFIVYGVMRRRSKIKMDLAAKEILASLDNG